MGEVEPLRPIEFYGMSALEQPITLRYGRRRDRWLARLWPPARKRHRMRQQLADYSVTEIQRMYNRTLTDLLVYGSALVSSHEHGGLGEYESDED